MYVIVPHEDTIIQQSNRIQANARSSGLFSIASINANSFYHASPSIKQLLLLAVLRRSVIDNNNHDDDEDDNEESANKK
jgi:hypothetical protein